MRVMVGGRRNMRPPFFLKQILPGLEALHLSELFYLEVTHVAPHASGLGHTPMGLDVLGPLALDALPFVNGNQWHKAAHISCLSHLHGALGAPDRPGSGLLSIGFFRVSELALPALALGHLDTPHGRFMAGKEISLIRGLRLTYY
jgi:hypothetical protein